LCEYKCKKGYNLQPALVLVLRFQRKPVPPFLSSYPASLDLSAFLGLGFLTEMPKNKGKGGKNRKRGKNEADDEKRELVFKEDGQEYAQVIPYPLQLCILIEVHLESEGIGNLNSGTIVLILSDFQIGKRRWHMALYPIIF
jgi:hypothetical protein